MSFPSSTQFLLLLLLLLRSLLCLLILHLRLQVTCQILAPVLPVVHKHLFFPHLRSTRAGINATGRALITSTPAAADHTHNLWQMGKWANGQMANPCPERSWVPAVGSAFASRRSAPSESAFVVNNYKLAPVVCDPPGCPVMPEGKTFELLPRRYFDKQTGKITGARLSTYVDDIFEKSGTILAEVVTVVPADA
ncbi:hypothetical protein C8Q76DRAFT_693050 [Earliella scabrosa]|nr:hypothetical protein C8Q76DRAFT_693050 [Earliella scabrosa]